MSLAHPCTQSRPAAARAGHKSDQLLRGLRLVRGSGARGGALPIILSRFHCGEPDGVGPAQAKGQGCRDRVFSAANRSACRGDINGRSSLTQAITRALAMDAQVTKVRPITIAILALGGEGGGVLADWMVDLAEHSGYLAQATSVPGVAQRTGATVYYVELFPKSAAQVAGRAPVLGLLPMPGDVDIVLSSELMEGARAVERGFVTPERTLLITSTHRVFSMTERIAL